MLKAHFVLYFTTQLLYAGSLYNHIQTELLYNQKYEEGRRSLTQKYTAIVTAYLAGKTEQVKTYLCVE